MRVLYFSNGYSPHDHRFLAALAKTEHEVFYLRLEANHRQVEDRPVPAEIRQVQWAGGRGKFRWRDVPRLWSDLRRVIHEIKPNLVHAGPIQTCAFLVAIAGFHPLLTMSWGFDLMQDVERNVWWRWVTYYTLKHSTFFVSDAQVTRNKAVAYGMDPNCTVVFPWGVDLAHFRPVEALQAPSGGSSGEGKGKGRQAAKKAAYTLFCNRSWEPRYGVGVLARAFVKVAQQRPDVGLLLLGGGSQANVIRQILLAGGVLDRVQFPGHVSQSDLPRWYQMADLYISPSHVDGSSVSLMEALGCGLPVLVSDIPANCEWVTDGVNGWLFPDGDADALAARILAILERRDLSDVRRAARQTAEERADWSNNFGALLKSYERAVHATG
ncbi:MAG: glycosyltransferase [Anaerolineae bacterium]